MARRKPITSARTRTVVVLVAGVAALVAAWTLRGAAEADGCPARPCHPAPPRSLRVTERAPTTVALAWRRPAGGRITGFEIFENGLRARFVHRGRVTFTGLRCATRYRFTVRTRDTRGRRSSRATLFVTTAPCPPGKPGSPAAPDAPTPTPDAPPPPSSPGPLTPPATPPDHQAPTTPKTVKIGAATTSSVTVTWSPSTDDVAVAGYNLLVDGARSAQTTATTSFTFANLACGTKHTFGVQAVDAAGNVSAVATSKGATSSCPPPPGSAGCPGNPLKGVQVPGHLKVLDSAHPCRTAVGVITSTQPQGDGDCHVKVKVDAAYAGLLNSANHGELVTEVIPNHRVAIPKPGSRVSVTGSWVRDVPNGWNELHPVWSFQLLSGSTGSC